MQLCGHHAYKPCVVPPPQGLSSQAPAPGEGDPGDGEDYGGPETHAGQVFGAGEGEQETGGAGTRGPEGDYQTEGGTAGQQGQGESGVDLARIVFGRLLCRLYGVPP